MDFFQQQDDARRKTVWLVFAFILAVLGIILAVYLVVVFAFGLTGPRGTAHHGPTGLWNPMLLVWISLGTMAVVTAGSMYKIAELASGGETVALLLGGRLVDRQTSDPAEKRLLNVVDEMAIASGTPVPPVYVLDGEPGINAFAAGHQPGDAVVAVSRGCLDYLTRDELQGVMGHEFSHVLNGDMRLNLRLMGILHGILVLAILGYYVMRFSGNSRSGNSNNRGGAGAMVLVGLGLLIVGYIGVFFGKLIKSAVSRQREYLADAAAVQFTRYPAGIAGALKKIGGQTAGSRIRNTHAEEASHMFFGDALAGTLANLFATHPPLDKRIARLDPSFDGTFPEVQPLGAGEDSGPSADLLRRRREFLETLGGAAGGAAGPAAAIDPAGVLGRVGVAGLQQILFAGALLAEMPQPLRAASSEPYTARALIYALLLDRREQIRTKQLDLIRQRAEDLSCRQTSQLAAQAGELHEGSLLSLVDLSLPALKQLSPDQYGAFRDNVQALVEADANVDLFEYAVRTMLFSNLDVHFGRTRPSSPRYAAITPLVNPAAIALSTLARAGQESEPDAQAAFDLGMKEIGVTTALVPLEQCGLRAFDEALQALAQATPPIKKRIMAACAACTAADRKVTVKEWELMRAVAATLGCPIPPTLSPARES